MPAITVLALLMEGNKLDTYEKRFALQASMYPYTDEQSQNTVKDSLSLPDDILSDILDTEPEDDINKLKDALGDL